MRLVIAQLRNLPQAALAQQRHIDCRRQRQQALIGADVGRGALAFDVLFARGERQHVGALAAVVHGFTDQPAGHLVDEGFLGGEEAERTVRQTTAECRAAVLRRRRYPRPSRRES